MGDNVGDQVAGNLFFDSSAAIHPYDVEPLK
jgi:hypothetical protein